MNGRKDDEPLTEKHKNGLEQANKLITWLEEKKLTEPIVMAAHMTICDPGKMIDSHKAALNFIRPLSRIWRTYYMRLYDLKQRILSDEEKEKEQNASPGAGS